MAVTEDVRRQVARAIVTRVKDRAKREVLLAAVRSPELVKVRMNGAVGITLHGPNGVVNTHWSGVESKGPRLTTRRLRAAGLLP